MATITLTDVNSDGVGIDLLDYIADFDQNFTRGYYGFFSDVAGDYQGNQYAFSESTSTTVSGVAASADSVVMGSGSTGEFDYEFATHTLAGTFDSVSFGQGLGYNSATDSFSQSASDIAITGLDLSGSGAGNPVHTLIYDLMGGSSAVLLSVLNAQGNTIVGSTGDDTIYSFNGTDTLTGNGGSDLFVFDGTDGADTITDFNVADDYIDVSAWGASTALSITDGASGAIISYGSNSVTVLNVAAAALTSDIVWA